MQIVGSTFQRAIMKGAILLQLLLKNAVNNSTRVRGVTGRGCAGANPSRQRVKGASSSQRLRNPKE